MTDIRLASLHRYWVTADAIKVRMLLDVPGDPKMPKSLQDIGQELSRVQTIIVFYGLVYVVIEGFRQLQCKDEAIEALLAEGEYVGLLRRFRNVVFHYQEDPFDARLIDFLNAKESEIWMQKLYAAFEAFFLRVLPIREAIDKQIRAFRSESPGA